jgi:hypothetical protein
VNGLLTYRHKHPFSKSRETFILNYLEKEDIRETLALRSVMYTILGAALGKSEFIEPALEGLQNYVQLALPSLIKDSNMETKKFDPEVLKSVKALLGSRKKETPS